MLVEIEKEYKVVDSNQIIVSVIVGEEQTGRIAIYLNDVQKIKEWNKIKNFFLGEGFKIRNQLLQIDTNVIESNSDTNRTAVTYFLAGGEPTKKKFKFPEIVANDNESVFYRAKITLV